VKRDETARKALKALREETEHALHELCCCDEPSPADVATWRVLEVLDARLRLLEDDNG
jgi:hypothetical protein